LPAVAGVPPIAPELFMDKPAGKPVAENEYPDGPPVAAREAE
jgi:hypothetical protein